MKPEYRPELDGLRAVAVGAVILTHSDAPAFAGGQQGVDAFFVLSGYLITSMLLPGRLSLAEFWARRLLRLYPALLFLLAAYVALAPLAGQPTFEVVWAALYATDFRLAAGAPGAGLLHTWSLAVEMQFYLLWPFALRWIIQRPAPFVGLLGLWATVTVARWLLLAQDGGWTMAYFSPFTRCSGLILGSALCFAPTLRPRWALVGVGLAAGYAVAAACGLPRLTFGTPLVEVGTALVLAARHERIRSALAWGPMVWVGQISYGLYLWHFPVAVWLKALPWYAQLLGSLVVALPMATLSFYTVERWANRLRQRLMRERLGAMATIS